MVALLRVVLEFQRFSRSQFWSLAAEKALVELPIVIAKLQQTVFFISQEILDAALDRDKQRRENKK